MSTLTFRSKLVCGTFPRALKQWLHYIAVDADQLKNFNVSLAGRTDGIVDLVIIPQKEGQHPYIMPIGTYNDLGDDNFCELELDSNSPRLLLYLIDPQRAKSAYWRHEDWDTLELEAQK